MLYVRLTDDQRGENIVLVEQTMSQMTYAVAAIAVIHILLLKTNLGYFELEPCKLKT